MKKYFKNKTVIVTGHTGFKGTWLTLFLTFLGSKVVGLSSGIPSKPSLFQILKLSKKIRDIRVDVRDLKKMKIIFKKHKPDYVFHLAAQSLVKRSFKNPIYTFSTNFLGTLNVLESIKQLKKNCISVIITSDKSYKNFELQRGYKENDILGGDDPYSASKGCAELVIQSYCKSFFKKNDKKRIGIARAGNVIGGGDWSEDRLVPDCIKSWSKKKRVMLRNPNSTRPWQHVLEAVWGYLILAIKLKEKSNLHGEAFNFGPNKKENKSVLKVVTEMRKSWKAVSWNIEKQKEEKESKLLKLNSNKAKKKLGWKTSLNFKETIKLTIDWYRNFYNKKSNNYNFSINQIISYQSKTKNKL